jgi:isopenicillin N synthase-like dioxygenase
MSDVIDPQAREIPVIDVAPFRDGSARAQVAEAVAQACETIGFFVITGHGIAPEKLTRLIAEARDFFDQPEALKTRIKRHGTNFGGPTYVPLNSESLGALDGEVGEADLKESLDVSPRHLGDHWVPGTEALHEAWSEAYAAYEALAADLRALFCVAAGLPEDALEPAFDKHASSTRMLNYPEVHGKLKAGQTRAGVHTDYGAFTVIRGDDAPGLQVRALDGTWVDVPAVPGSFVVNIGDLLMRWTNDRWFPRRTGSSRCRTPTIRRAGSPSHSSATRGPMPSSSVCRRLYPQTARRNIRRSDTRHMPRRSSANRWATLIWNCPSTRAEPRTSRLKL